MNRYNDLRRTFQFLECAARQKELLSRCRELLPPFLSGHTSEAVLRDYIFCLMLVALIAQLEADIERLAGVPGLNQAGGLLGRLRVLRDHHQIPVGVFDAVDRISGGEKPFRS